MEKIFLFELMIEKINFKTTSVPKRDDIVFRINVGDVFSLESKYEHLRKSDTNELSSDSIIEYNTGKSYFFVHPADKFRTVLKENPLTITLFELEVPLGLTKIPWHDAFINMVEENITYSNMNSSPVSYKDEVDILKGSKKLGSIALFVRLTCFGKSVFMIFQVVEPINPVKPRQFFYKGTERDIVFQTQRYGLGVSTEAIPIAPLFNAPVNAGEDNSFETVLNDSKGSQFSYFRGKKSLEGIDRYNVQNMTTNDFRKILCKNPECVGNASFREFGINVLEKERTNKIKRKPDDNIPIDHGLTHAVTNFDNYGPDNPYRRPKRLDQPFIPKIANKGKSLRGGGPLRLKGGNGQFPVENDCNLEDITCEENGNTEEKSVDKRKKFNYDDLASLYIEEPSKEFKNLMYEYDQCLKSFKEALGPCGKATCTYTPNLIQISCQAACASAKKFKDEDESKIETESLGFDLDPTSHVSESEDVNNSRDNLSKSVKNDGDNGKLQIPAFPLLNNSNENKISACGIANCPHSRTVNSNVEKNMKLLQIKPACGLPNCPFAKKIVGTANSDDMQWLQYLAVKPQKKCGKTDCKYFVPDEIPLPPIHWDCPEPLPEGNCRNPDCPFLPAVLRKLKPKNIIDEILKNIPDSIPCGNPCCPYCPYPPCANPGCCCCISPPLCIPYPNNNSKSCPPPTPYPPPFFIHSQKGKSCACGMRNEESDFDQINEDNTNKSKQNEIICTNSDCPDNSVNKLENIQSPPDYVDSDENPCHLPSDDCGLPCRSPYCRFQKDDGTCVNPKCAYNKENKLEYIWCKDPGCSIDEELFKRVENDFCKEMVCPKISFTGFLYK